MVALSKHFFAHFEITPFLYQHKLCNRVEYQFLPVLVISMEIYFSYEDQLTNHYHSRKYIFRQYACTSNHCKIVIWFSFKIGKYCFVKFIFEKVNIVTVHIYLLRFIKKPVITLSHNNTLHESHSLLVKVHYLHMHASANSMMVGCHCVSSCFGISLICKEINLLISTSVLEHFSIENWKTSTKVITMAN